MQNPTGRFITFEGGEGVGKSTNIQALAEYLRSIGKTVIVTREPGGTPIAEKIRNDLLKAHHEEPMAPMAELLLMFAARAQHVDAVIRPALERGDWVLCDRFTDSTIAYQGYGRGLSLSTIEQLKTMAQGDFSPDHTILLDAPASVGMTRARARGEELNEETDRFETEEMAFFERAREGFLALARSESRFHIVDASQSLDDVTKQVLALFEIEGNI
ncbi:dTMP kinase [Thalassolituus maritimus]|uniref:Thymidylate kinase n=1 Tax=Thalassolituus maritimus TaxID=484498 RepID=A0ABQ0A1R1_9GAMM